MTLQGNHKLVSLRLRDGARRIVQIAPGETLCKCGIRPEVFVRKISAAALPSPADRL
jgi:hypothetical protein